MTLRRFMVLVRGLSPDSVTALRHAGYLGSGPRAVRESQSPQESENVLAAAFGFRPAQVH